MWAITILIKKPASVLLSAMVGKSVADIWKYTRYTLKKLVKEVIKIGSSSEYKVYAALRMIEQLTDDELLPRYIFKNILKDYEDIVDTTKFNTNEKTM